MKDMMSKLMKQADDVGDKSHTDAKMQVLEELREMANQMMGGKVDDGDVEEVVVSAGSPSKLAEGLEMAQNVLPDDGHSTEKAMGTPNSNQYSEEDDMELDEIEDLMRELENKRRAKLMQKA